MKGRWRLVSGHCCCSHCGQAVEQAWRWYPGQPGLWTNALCLDCANELVEEAG